MSKPQLPPSEAPAKDLADSKALLASSLATAAEAREHVEALLTAHLRKRLTAGEYVRMGGPAEHEAKLRIIGGHAYGVKVFILAADPVVTVEHGRVIDAKWTARANTVGAGRHQSREVMLQAPLFAFLDIQAEGVPNGPPYIEFADAYVDHWMRCEPDRYRPLRAADHGRQRTFGIISGAQTSPQVEAAGQLSVIERELGTGGLPRGLTRELRARCLAFVHQSRTARRAGSVEAIQQRIAEGTALRAEVEACKKK